MSQVPSIPNTAPFSPEQIQWLNGYLAGLFSDHHPAAATPSGPRIVLMFGSQSGNAAGLCEEFSETLREKGYDAPVIDMEDHRSIDLGREEHLLLVSSTWGEGDPPDNAAAFWDHLTSEDHPRLEKLKFSVLALGDTNYLDFCAMGKRFDARLEALGARRIAPRADCDTDFEDAAAEWLESLLVHLPSPCGGPGAVRADDRPCAPSSPKASKKKQTFPATLRANRKLNLNGSERDTRHFEIHFDDPAITYEVGDVLGVHPENCPAAVAEVLELLPFTGNETVTAPGNSEISLREALLRHYDISSLSPKLLEAWTSRSQSPELAALRESGDKAATAAFLDGRALIDLAEDHAAAFADAADFVSILKKLAPRLYSIASSPRAHPGEVHLTVARVAYETHSRSRVGVCSSFLADRVAEGGALQVFFQGAAHFKLPRDGAIPVIMIGPGTGIAPFRAFLEERHTSNSKGDNWLFTGNPHKATDFFYREELETLRAEGTLTRLDTAWSRDQQEKIYVQDRMRESAADLWRWLEAGAHFYVCGDAKRMARDVDQALHDIIAAEGGFSQEGAAEYVQSMKKAKRYQRDVY